MLSLIMLGLIGQQLLNLGNLFWGLYIFSWIIWTMKLIIGIIAIVIQVKKSE